MKLENIKTENDVRQLLIENIVNIKSALCGTDIKKLYRALNKYDQNLSQINKMDNFDIDTTPYNNVTNSLLNLSKKNY